MNQLGDQGYGLIHKHLPKGAGRLVTNGLQ